MPPLWSLGYQQSHRTLASREEVLSIARTFREKKLPCDALIYLGTGFCPSGWNTGHGSFTFNPSVFPDPKAMLDELHAHAFPRGAARRHPRRSRCSGTRRAIRSSQDRADEADAACYWTAHRERLLPGRRRLVARRGRPARRPLAADADPDVLGGPQLDRPDRRPYALHRNGYAGMQRYGAFLWSGDVYSTWETLKTHVPVAINTALTGIPYWGTDIGGFVPTRELTGELYVRWFQFGAFCPLFRSHGRTWKLRLPWGWNTGELGPNEIRGYGDAANPGPERAAQRGGRADLPQVSRAALSAACRTSTASSARAARRACRSCARSGCTTPTTRRPSPGATSSSGARTSWWRP